MQIYFVIFICFYSNIIFAQEKQIFSVQHFWNNKNLELNKKYISHHQDSVSIQTLKYYISNIEFLNKKKIVWKESNSFHLIDEEKAMSKTILFTKVPTNMQFDEIQFNLGIDSATNYAGVQSGDLDPINGMYWTWQNGYINFKLEGKSSLCKTRNNIFQFHIGGYENGFATIQKVNVKVYNNEPLYIKIDIERLFYHLALSTQNEIMQPCKEAVEIANKLPIMFTQE